MVQATTPTFVFTFPNEIDPSEASSIVFTMKQGSICVNKTGNELTVDGQDVSVYLSQENTILFKEGPADLMLNWVYPNEARACSTIMIIEVTENLLKEVIS